MQKTMIAGMPAPVLPQSNPSGGPMGPFPGGPGPMGPFPGGGPGPMGPFPGGGPGPMGPFPGGGPGPMGPFPGGGPGPMGGGPGAGPPKTVMLQSSEGIVSVANAGGAVPAVDAVDGASTTFWVVSMLTGVAVGALAYLVVLQL